jgi:hypothetical protein
VAPARPRRDAGPAEVLRRVGPDAALGKDWPATALGLLRAPRRGAVVVELRKGCWFELTTALELWIVKEVGLDRESGRGGTTIRNGWTVLDIGAGLGEFAIPIAREHPDCRVYAFEPAPEPFAFFRVPVGLRAVQNVSLVPAAVGGAPAAPPSAWRWGARPGPRRRATSSATHARADRAPARGVSRRGHGVLRRPAWPPGWS